MIRKIRISTTMYFCIKRAEKAVAQLIANGVAASTDTRIGLWF